MFKFRKMQRNDQPQILGWRSSPHVSRYMLTDVVYDLDRQYCWFDKISQSQNDLYWVIECNSKPIGIISLTEIDRVNRHASWGLYLGERLEMPVGGLIPFYFYNYIFLVSDLGLHKLHGKVVQGNNSILKNHKICGYREVGVYREHLLRNGEYLDVYLVELFREKWLEKSHKYSKYIADFER